MNIIILVLAAISLIILLICVIPPCQKHTYTVRTTSTSSKDLNPALLTQYPTSVVNPMNNQGDYLPNLDMTQLQDSIYIPELSTHAYLDPTYNRRKYSEIPNYVTVQPYYSFLAPTWEWRSIKETSPRNTLSDVYDGRIYTIWDSNNKLTWIFKHKKIDDMYSFTKSL